MVPNMRATTSMERNKESEHLSGEMGLLTSVNSTTTICMEREFIHGVTKGDMRVNGKSTKCMVRVHLLGQTGGNM